MEKIRKILYYKLSYHSENSDLVTFPQKLSIRFFPTKLFQSILSLHAAATSFKKSGTFKATIFHKTWALLSRKLQSKFFPQKIIQSILS